MNSEQTYRVEAVRSGDWWAITVPELAGVFSQAKRLDQVESRAREAIATNEAYALAARSCDPQEGPPGQ